MRMTLATVGVAVVALTLTGWGWTSDAQQQDENAQAGQVCTLKVSGMTCAGCAAAVKMAAQKVDGVKDAKVSYEKGTAEVTYDQTKTSPEKIAKAITENSGFRAEVPKKGKR